MAQKITYIDEPNMIVPLAASLNQRGILGYTQAITNADDQLKINSIYEPVHNAATGKDTLYLCKRPGVTQRAGTYAAAAASSYVAHLVGDFGGAADFIIHSEQTSTIRYSNQTSSYLVSTEGQSVSPAWVDARRIAGLNYTVIGNQNVNVLKIYYGRVAASFTDVAQVTQTQQVGKMEFLDGYAFIQSQQAGNPIFNSDLNSWNFTATGFVERSSKLDAGIGLAKLGPQIISFGTGCMEVFRNSGTAFGSPLESVPALAQTYGMFDITLSSNLRNYYTEVAGRIYWRGENPLGVFTYNGQTVEKVSSPAVDKILAERQHTNVGQLAFSGQQAIAISLDDASATPQRALLYFPAWKDWFIWQSNVFQCQSTLEDNTLCLGTSSAPNKLYRIATTTNAFQDNGTNYTWTHQFKLRKNGNGFQRMDMFGLMGDTATSALSIDVQFSDDDYASLTTARQIDMTSHKKSLTRCGGYRTPRAVLLSYSGDQPLRLEAAMARIG